MNDRAKDETQSSTPSSVKKAYRAPALIEWGTLPEITQTAGKTSTHSDGGLAKAPNKTH